MSIRISIISIVFLVCMDVAAQSRKIIVAKDGSGNFTSVQAAINVIPRNNRNPVTVYIRNGFYKEKLTLDASRPHVSFVGENKFNTIISYDDHTGKISPKGDTINTYSSATFLEDADDFSADNITFQNDAGFSAGQAVAVQVNGDKAVFDNCRFVGFQDVLFTNSAASRQFYRYCYIEGTTDFIFGSATVWFQQCHIHSKKNSHVTAAATPRLHPFGFIFYDCVLTADSALDRVSLGRPWRPFAAVSYLHCYLGNHFLSEGWSNWNQTDNFKTARYAEYKNYGPGAKLHTRVQWSRQLTDEEARQYRLDRVFPGWDIKKALAHDRGFGT